MGLHRQNLWVGPYDKIFQYNQGNMYNYSIIFIADRYNCMQGGFAIRAYRAQK